MSPQVFTPTHESGTLSSTLGALFARRCSHSILLLIRRLAPEKSTRLAAIKNRLTDRFHSSFQTDFPPVNVYCPPGHAFPHTLSASLHPRSTTADEPLFSAAWIFWDLKAQPVPQHELTRYIDDTIRSLPKNYHPAVIVQTETEASPATDELLGAVKLHLNGTSPCFIVMGSQCSLVATNHPDSSWSDGVAAKTLAATLCYPLFRELLAEIGVQFPDDKEQAMDLKTFRQIFLDTFNDQ